MQTCFRNEHKGQLASAGDLLPQWLLAIAEQPAPLGFKSVSAITGRDAGSRLRGVAADSQAYMGLSGDFQLMVRAAHLHEVLIVARHRRRQTRRVHASSVRSATF